MANSRWQTDQYYLYLASACAVDFRLVSMIVFATFKMLLPKGQGLQPCFPSVKVSGRLSPCAVRDQPVPSLSVGTLSPTMPPPADVHHNVGFRTCPCLYSGLRAVSADG